MDYTKIAKEVLLTEAKELENASALLGDEIGQVVELVSHIKGKLIVTGVGKSGLVGSKMAATFASTGTSSFFLHPTEAMHGDFGMIGKEDALLAISYSGESEELIRILPHIKRFDIPLIGMAKDKESTLGRYSDVFLSIMIEKEACPLNTAPTSSTTLTMALGDALAVCLMKKKDFQKEDFASFHPGGSLGKQLFVKIKDMMRDKNLPVVTADTPLKDAIVVMSEGRLGNVLIADSKGRLEGVLSDGDLRRALMKEGFSLENSVMEYATKDPRFITDENILASDAIKMIEEFKLQHLVVTDKARHIKGVLHIHDLVEAGIK
jgi:arabinose-5-phosphate isomerase